VIRFTESVDSAVAKSTHKIIIDKSNNNESVTPQIREHIRNRNKLKKIWQRTANPGLKDQVRRLNHKIRNEIRVHRSTTWDAKLKSRKATMRSIKLLNSCERNVLHWERSWTEIKLR
jgi:hypothetical protein